MKLKTKKIKHCLLCKSKNIKKIFSLGNLYVSNFVKKNNIKKGLKAPLKLLFCNAIWATKKNKKMSFFD